MSVFEDKIKRESKFFNSKEPKPGHKERFLDKLEQMPSDSKNQSGFTYMLKVAAVVVVLISIGYAAFFSISNSKENNQLITTLEYGGEMVDVLAYYDAASETRFEKIDELVTNTEEAQRLKDKAQGQLNNIDISLAKIEKEFSKNPENENIKAALINNKRKKVEVMDRIILQIDFANSGVY